ncbi:CpsD/CapB family tyrosine-protein kinase [Listeria aquatica]|uniref:CpsD/CapB family tyrosine-protein kinase n=1 Tax=Listeria aquatica TaxID=1494960 RepID=UPI003F6E8395
MKKEERKQLITYRNPTSPVSEQFKTIRTSIDFSAVDSAFQTILVTSPEAGSGKSTIAANLAIVYAQQGKKILLIDGDLRKPTVHKTFFKNMYCGLSNVLTDQIELNQACQKTEIDNLSVLTSGAIPPNPNEMLSSNKMTAMLEELKREYDLIIVDTPPVTIVSDALVIAQEIDGVILTVRYGVTLKERIKQAVEQINMTRTPIIGTVLNGVSEKKSNYYYYAYK